MGFLKASLTVVGAVVLVGAASVATAGSAAAAEGWYFYPGTTEWTVPAGVSSIRVELYGAQGGAGDDPVTQGASPGGQGGHTHATLNVTAGEKLQLNVGGQGTKGGYAGSNGGGVGGSWAGGGGGSTDIRIGGTGLENRVVVAGGGGGAGSYYAENKVFYHNGGGSGGGETGTRDSDIVCPDGHEAGYFPGSGGTASGGGKGGLYSCGKYKYAADGGKGYGGAGYHRHSGGGGGGYFGGGGGGAGGATAGNFGSLGFGGGGGSGYADPLKASDVKFETGVRPGDGLMTIAWGW